MDIIDPLVAVELNRQTPVPYNVPWTANDFLDHDLLRHVLKRFDAAGRPHSQFFIAADEIRQILYEDLSREPVDWCSQPIALGMRYVQWRLMQCVCAYFKLSFPVGEGFLTPLSKCGPPDFAYSTHFKQLVAKNEDRRRSLEMQMSNNIQHRLRCGGIKEEPENLNNARAKRTAEDAGVDAEMTAPNKTARHVAPKESAPKEPAPKQATPKQPARKRPTPKKAAPKKAAPKKTIQRAAPEITVVRRTMQKIKTKSRDD